MHPLQREQLEAAVQRIVAAVQPEAIYLYGSYAYGQPHPHSDVDLLVIVSNASSSPREQAVAAYRALRGLSLPIEIKVVTQQDFQRRMQWTSSLERMVQEHGELLYGRPIR